MFDLGLVRVPGELVSGRTTAGLDAQRSLVVAVPAVAWIVAWVFDLPRPVEIGLEAGVAETVTRGEGARLTGTMALSSCRLLTCKATTAPAEVRERMTRAAGTPCLTKLPRHLSPIQPTLACLH